MPNARSRSGTSGRARCWRACLFVLLTQIFPLYLHYLGAGFAAYKALGVFLLLMTWFYFLAMILCAGALLNAVLSGHCPVPDAEQAERDAAESAAREESASTGIGRSIVGPVKVLVWAGLAATVTSLMLILARRLAGTVWRALTRQEPPLWRPSTWDATSTSLRRRSRAASRTCSPIGASPGGTRLRRWLLVAIARPLLLLVGSLWLISGQIGRPFVYDDVSFILGCARHRRYRAAVREPGLHAPPVQAARAVGALAPAPLYVPARADRQAVRRLRAGRPRARGRSACWSRGVLAFDLARRVVLSRGGKSAAARWSPGVLAVALYALNPLAIQAAMILDIDNTVLMVLLTALVWLAIRLPGLLGPRGPSSAWRCCTPLSIWAKMTTPLALGGRPGLHAAVPAGRLARRAPGAGGRRARLVDLRRELGRDQRGDRDADRLHAGRRPQRGDREQRQLAHRLVSLQAFTSASPRRSSGSGRSSACCSWRPGCRDSGVWCEARGCRPADLLVVLGAAIYLAYIFKLAGNLPEVPRRDAAALGRGGRRAGRVHGRPPDAGPVRRRRWSAGPCCSGWLGNRMAGALGHRLGGVAQRRVDRDPAADRARDRGGSGRWSAGATCSGRFPVALFVLTLGLVGDARPGAAERAGSTTYYYGRHGQSEAAAAVDALLQPGELYVASKDVAWYTRNREYVDQESWQHVVWDLNGGRYDDTYLGMPIRVMVLEIGEETLRWAYDGALLRARLPLAGEHGNFLIYLRPVNPQSAATRDAEQCSTGHEHRHNAP